MAATLAWGLLIIRVVGGLTLAAHGAQKAFGWFGGSGPVKLTQGFKTQGYRPAWLWAGLVILGELGGGLSLAFGLLTPLGAAGAVGAMVMAIAKAHWKNGFWNSKRGLEFPLQLLAIGAAIGIAGPGTFSLDGLLAIGWSEVGVFAVLALLAVVVDAVGLLMTRPAPAQPVGTAGSAPTGA
jgi:putative oxidoreductase